MAKVRLRRLVVEGRPFLWRRTHRHVSETEPRRCEERLRVFAEDNKKAVLEITFGEQPGWQVGYPQEGVVWSTTEATSYNLNRPAVIRTLIELLLKSEWRPHEGGAAVRVADGIPLLAFADAPIGDT